MTKEKDNDFFITQQYYCYHAEMLDGLRHLQIIKILGVTFANGFSATLYAQQYIGRLLRRCIGKVYKRLSRMVGLCRS